MFLTALLVTSMIACQGLDVGTTYAGLHSGRFVEANPIMRGPQMYVAKVGINVGMLIWRQRSAPTSPAKQIIPAGLAIAGCGAAAWNAHQLRGQN